MFRGIAVILAIVGIFAFSILVIKQNKEIAHNPPATLPAINPYLHTVAASGIIESFNDNVAIGIPLTGLVKAVHVKVWDRISEGQPLFEIDQRELEAQLIVQKAHLNVSQADFDRLESQYSRLQGAAALDTRMVCQEELCLREKEMLVAKAQVDLAASQHKQTQMLIDRLSIKAPRKGVILQVNIHPGEICEMNSQSPAMMIGNIEKLQMRVDIDEQDAWQIKGGEEATAYPKNHSDLPIVLKFERIEPLVIPKKSLTGSSDERVDTRVLQLIYTFSAPEDFPLYVGQQADVFIKVKDTSEKENRDFHARLY